MAVAAVALCATSCKKDGVYKPGKQIAKIVYIDDEDGTTEPYETWNWDGKLLKSITYHWLSDANGEPCVETFTYDGNRIVASDFDDGHTTYTYDGKRLSSFEFTWGDTSLWRSTVVYSFEYEGDRISTITQSGHTVTPEKRLPMGMLRMMLPEPVCQQIQRDGQREAAEAAKLGAKNVVDIVRTYKLTWEGSNIAKVECECRSNDELIYTTTEVMTYDDMHNPFMDLHDETRMFYIDMYVSFCSNNVLTWNKYYGAESNTPEYSSTYTYKYDEDGYPVEYVLMEVGPYRTTTSKFALEYSK